MWCRGTTPRSLAGYVAISDAGCKANSSRASFLAPTTTWCTASSICTSGLDDIARLDAFEGHLYDRHTAVCTGRDQHTYAVDLYVIKPRYRALVADEAWDVTWFATEGLPQFLSRSVFAPLSDTVDTSTGVDPPDSG